LTRQRAEVRAAGDDARTDLLRDLQRFVLAVLVGPDENVRDADLLGRRVLRLVQQIDLPRATHEIIAPSIEGRRRFALDLLAARDGEHPVDLRGDARLDFGILVETLGRASTASVLVSSSEFITLLSARRSRRTRCASAAGTFASSASNSARVIFTRLVWTSTSGGRSAASERVI
jgi:hypothetical protein